MSAVNPVIEAAARVLFEDSGRPWAEAEEWERDMERATAAVLHNAGMLATCTEWRAAHDPGLTFTNQCVAYKYAEGGTVERRGVTEWRADQ